MTTRPLETLENGRAIDSRPGVLLVADDIMSGPMLEAVLCRNGFLVHSAHSIAGALDAWAEHKDQLGLLVIDLQLESLMDGWELWRQVYEQKPVSCIIVTACAGDLHEFELEKVRFLSKPLSLCDLLRVIGVLLPECSSHSPAT